MVVFVCVVCLFFFFFGLQVEKELKSICNDILDVLDKHLILAANTGESKVFYYKMYVSNKRLYFYYKFILTVSFIKGRYTYI